MPYVLNVGDGEHYLKWDGAVLFIKGMVSLDALSVLNADLGHITAGDITLDNSGFIRTSGKTSYADIDAGFWLGYVDGKYKLNIGSSASYLKWTGTQLELKGMLELDNIYGHVKTKDKDSYTDTTPGFWLGYDPGDSKYKLNIGDADHFLKWNGVLLDIQGKLHVGGLGTNDEIYFKDSGITLYDLGSTNIRFYKSATQYMDFDLGASVHGIYAKQPLNLASYSSPIKIIVDGRNFYFYSGGDFKLPSLTSSPTAHEGAIAYNSADNRLCIFAGGQWKHFDMTVGW